MAGLVPSSAGVRFRETNLSEVIASNSSSRAAIVFVSKQGRTGRFNITNNQAFVTEYGTPDASVSFGHYCALNFLSEGTSLDCVRVVASDALLAALLMTDSIGVTTLENLAGAGVNGDPANFNFETATANTPLILFTPKRGPGSYADSIAVKIKSENIESPATVTGVATATGGTIGSGTYTYEVTAISEIGETLSTTSADVVIGLVEGSTNKITVTWSAVEGARGYKVYGRTTGGMGLIATVGAGVLSYVDTGVVTPGTGVAPTVAPTPTTRFTVQVFDTNLSTSRPTEEFLVSLTDDVDDTGTQLEISQRMNAFSDALHITSWVPALLGSVPVIKTTPMMNLSGGNSGSAVTNFDIAAAWVREFSDVDKVKVQILINGGYTDISVQQAMASLAESRGDAVALLDMPQSKQLSADAIAHRQLELGIDSTYAALFCSDVFESDTYNGKKLYIPLSGWAAAICARTDRLVGAQGAPAGPNRGVMDVLGQRYEYDEQQRTDLYSAQINYPYKMVGVGTVLWEQVTLSAKHSALSWLNVRRMVNVIKSSVKDFLMFSLQEPNDDFTRRQIVTACTEYLQSWKDSRGILDFKVVCDDTNNDAAHYNLGILKVAFFITPIIPIHEIQVDVVITKKGVQFNEINILALA